MRRCPIVSAAALLLAGVMAASANAQSPQVERDVVFVRQLAKKLGFISLAKTEVDRMMKRYSAGEDFQAVAQLGIEVSLIGAKIHPNRDEKRTLFGEALKQSDEFITRYPDGKAALDARVTMADASMEFGNFLAEEIELAREEEPDKVEELEKQAAEVFRAGVDACNSVMKALDATKEDDPQIKLTHDLCWLRKGILLREQGRAVAKDRGYLLQKSRDELEELVFDVGEETVLGMTAMFEMFQADEVEGKLAEAIDGYEGVIDSSKTVLNDDGLDLPNELRERMVVMMESAYDRLARVMLDSGKADKVLELGKTYRADLEEQGVSLTKFEGDKVTEGSEDARFGHLFYITEAQAMADSGDPGLVQKGLAQVKYFNDQHPNDYVGLRAKAVLKNILAAQSQMVSGALLLEVAKGDLKLKEYELAISGAKRAIAAMTPTEAKDHGADAFLLLGRAYARSNPSRPLEATLALKTGLEKYGSNGGDSVEQLASLVQRTMSRVLADSKNDEFFTSLNDQIGDLAVRFGSNVAVDRAWTNGLRRMGEKRYEDAIKEFGKLPEDHVRYEQAMTRIMAANRSLGNTAKVLELVKQYRAYISSPKGEIPDGDAGNAKRQVRQAAQAETDFYEGMVTYDLAAGSSTNKKPDPTKFPEVIKLLSDWPSRHGQSAPNLLGFVNYVLGRAYIATGEIEKAEEKYRLLGKDGGNLTAVLATSIFNSYNDQIEALNKEVDSLYSQKQVNEAQQAETKLENVYKRAVAIGTDYFNGSDKPQYGISSLTLSYIEELGNWSEVETFGNKVIKAFENSKDAQTRNKVDQFVRASVGRAMLEQEKWQQAYDLLSAAEKANPKNYPVKRLVALALGGWKTYDKNGRPVVKSGLGKPDEAWTKYWMEYKTYGINPNRVPEFSVEWYRFQWEVYWFARQSVGKDTKFVGRQQVHYNKARGLDDFRKLQELGREGRKLFDLFRDTEPKN